MIAKNWIKWTAGTAAALLALAAMPAVGKARMYTGRTPASIAASTTPARHAVKLVVHKHKKHKKHLKHKSVIHKSHRTLGAKAKA